MTVHSRTASIAPGPGRAKIRFLSQASAGHRYVIPYDALALLRAGRLDKRLFDVTELASLSGGGKAGEKAAGKAAEDLPLLVAYPKGAAPAARAAITAGDARGDARSPGGGHARGPCGPRRPAVPLVGAHVRHAGRQRLPLSTVRFGPRLDDANSAPAGRRFEIPVTVEHQPGSDAGGTRSVRVDVPYDDGRTWQRADLRGQGDHRTATVRHPRGAAFVSLRATAADTKGNTASQTVIRAYTLR